MRRKKLIGGLFVVGGVGIAGYLLTRPHRTDLITDVRIQAAEFSNHGKNPIKNIDTIVLHQMAVADSDQVGWERWKKLEIHWVITEGPNARAYLLNDLDDKVWHGHGWNNRSVGFEIEGNFPGRIGKPTWDKKAPTPLTEHQVEAAQQAIRYTVQGIKNLGGRIYYIGAHRQSYANKPNDPGEEIWKQIAIPMMKELKLLTAPTLPGGSSIPQDWDPIQAGVKY